MINNRFTNFLLAPRYRTARHLFLQFVVFMITVNITALTKFSILNLERLFW